MDPKWQEYFVLHSKTDEFKQLLQQTQKNISFSLSQFINPAVSVSGGKDSLVLLHLCMQQKPNIWVWHWDYGIYMLRSIEKEIMNILQNFFVCQNLVIDTRKTKNPYSSVGYKAFFQALDIFSKKYVIDAHFIGLRKEESLTRKKRLKNLLHNIENGINVFPLSDWSWRDVWAYLVSHSIPYPSYYDTVNKISGYAQSRLVTQFDPEFAFLGNLEQSNFFYWSEK